MVWSTRKGGKRMRRSTKSIEYCVLKDLLKRFKIDLFSQNAMLSRNMHMLLNADYCISC